MTPTPLDSSTAVHSRRSALLRCGLGLALLASRQSPAIAQDKYPTKPVRIIVPWAAGTPPDVAARIVAGKLPEFLKQTVVVENRPGASGTIGLGELMRAPGDGYTMGALHYASTAVAPLFPQFKVDLAKDLTGLGQIEWGHNVLVVSPTLGVNTVPELVEHLKRNPGSFASSGVGSPAHLSGVMLLRTTGVQATHPLQPIWPGHRRRGHRPGQLHGAGRARRCPAGSGGTAQGPCRHRAAAQCEPARCGHRQ